MGNDGSKNRPEERIPQHTPHFQPRAQFSEADVAELLERQKQHFDKKLERLSRIQKDEQATSTTQSQTQNVAGSSSFAHPVRARPFIPSPTTSNFFEITDSFYAHQSAYRPMGPMPVIISAPPVVERTRSPYNLNQSQLNQASGSTLYPNLNTVQYQTQSNVRPSTSTSTSDFVFVNNSGTAGRCVPSAPPAPRERSTSRPRRKKVEPKDNSDDEWKCPTCKKMYGLTIFQCSREHSSCSECKKFRRCCGLCNLPITDMRNITLEALVSEVKVKCPNTEDGCHLFIKMADTEIHANECPFREMPCPLNTTFGCLWRGKLSQIESHFDNTHPINRQGAVDTEMTVFNLNNNCHIAQLVIIGNFNFMFHLVVSQTKQMVYMVVQLIGTNVSASKWTYDIHVYHKGQPRRKFQYVDVCHPINVSMNDIISESKCATLPLSYASKFVSDNKLTYKFYIKKDVNDKPFRNNRGRGRHRK